MRLDNIIRHISRTPEVSRRVWAEAIAALHHRFWKEPQVSALSTLRAVLATCARHMEPEALSALVYLAPVAQVRTGSEYRQDRWGDLLGVGDGQEMTTSP